MKTVRANEPISNLATVLKPACGGEEIGSRSDDTIVALRPLPVSASVTAAEPLPPRDALRRLQEEARLTPAQAESYLNEVRAERLATDERGVYRALPKSFTVIRYHSLVIARDTLPGVLEVPSTSDDGEIMGVRHRELAATKMPLEGVQFHPESILTEHGHAMLRNFLEMAS